MIVTKCAGCEHTERFSNALPVLPPMIPHSPRPEGMRLGFCPGGRKPMVLETGTRPLEPTGESIVSAGLPTQAVTPAVGSSSCSPHDHSPMTSAAATPARTRTID